MKIPTTGKNPRSRIITAAVAILAGAGLSGCVGDPFYDNPRFSQTTYNPPVYQSQPYYDSRYSGQRGYYDQYNPRQGYYYYPSR